MPEEEYDGSRSPRAPRCTGMAQLGMGAALHSAGHVVQHRGVSLDRWVDFKGFGEGAHQGVIFARGVRHCLLDRDHANWFRCMGIREAQRREGLEVFGVLWAHWTIGGTTGFQRWFGRQPGVVRLSSEQARSP